MVFIMLHGNQIICLPDLLGQVQLWKNLKRNLLQNVAGGLDGLLMCNFAVQWPAHHKHHSVITTWRQIISERHCSVTVAGMRLLAPTALLPWTSPWRPVDFFDSTFFSTFLFCVFFIKFDVSKSWVLPGIAIGQRRWGHVVCWDPNDFIYWYSNTIHSDCMTEPHITWIMWFHSAQCCLIVPIVIIFWNVVLAQAGFPKIEDGKRQSRQWKGTWGERTGACRFWASYLPVFTIYSTI